MSFLLELWDYLKTRKKYWMAPVLVIMLLIGALIVLQGTAVAPFTSYSTPFQTAMDFNWLTGSFGDRSCWRKAVA